MPKERNAARSQAVRKAFKLPDTVEVYSTEVATWIKGTETDLPAPAILSTKRGSYWVKLDAHLPGEEVASEGGEASAAVAT